MAAKPTLSVIMITEDKYEVCRRTISYLLAQSVVDQIEFVLVGPSRGVMQVDEAELAPFHSFKIIEIGKVNSTGQGLAAGTLGSTADLVTYAEEHGFPPANLFEVMLRNAGEKNYQACGRLGTYLCAVCRSSGTASIGRGFAAGGASKHVPPRTVDGIQR